MVTAHQVLGLSRLDRHGNRGLCGLIFVACQLRCKPANEPCIEEADCCFDRVVPARVVVPTGMSVTVNVTLQGHQFQNCCNRSQPKTFWSDDSDSGETSTSCTKHCWIVYLALHIVSCHNSGRTSRGTNQ